MVAYIAFKRQVELTYFMSISLFAMGILARIQFLIQELQENIKTAYETLVPIKNTSMKLPNDILSFKEFLEWDFSQNNNNLTDKEKIDLQGSSSDNDPDDHHVNASSNFKVEKSALSDEFWSKKDFKSKDMPKVNDASKKFKTRDASKKVKTRKIKESKKKDDLDKIFGNLC